MRHRPRGESLLAASRSSATAGRTASLSSRRARSGSGSGTAELEVEAPAPTIVAVFADARPVEPVLVGDRTTITVAIPNEGWHLFVVRAALGLRLVAARFN